MEDFEFDAKKFWRKNALSLAIFTLLGIAFVVYTVQRWVYAYQVEGQWVVFDSQDHMSGENNPDGFRLEVPKGWHFAVFENGGAKGDKELRAGFIYPFFVTQGDTYFDIFWRRADESWTLEDVRDWYIDEVGSWGTSREVLESQQYRTITIGVDEYTAWSKIAENYGRPNSGVILLLVDDEAFALVFETTDYKETNETFRRMLDTFEVYE